MRVTTDLWVSALLRRVFSAGGFAAVVSRGASEAGAVYLLVRNRTGEVHFYRPASQTSYDTARPDERLFSRAETLNEDEIEKKLESERRFDPDIWVVELELPSNELDELFRIAAE